MRMRVILASSLAFLLTTVVAAQDKDARRALETNLKDVYKVTKTQFFEKNNITSAGTIFVLQKDGIGVDMSEDALLHTNKVVEGEVKTGGGAGGLFSKSSTKFLSAGDRVYLTDLSVKDDMLFVTVLTKEMWGTQSKGTTKQMRYSGYLAFMVDKPAMAAMNTDGAKRLLEAVLMPEDKATAVQTKTIELGQTTEEVEKIFGKPESVAKLGSKMIYTYKTMKVVFIDGKVSDVQ